MSELTFKALRSSGAGGQHVNKVSSKIELQFSVSSSLAFSEDEKTLLLQNLEQRLTSDNRIVLQCSETRSQHKNKELIIQRFLELINKALVKKKRRIRTKVPKAVIKKRLTNKRMQSQRKANRKKPDID